MKMFILVAIVIGTTQASGPQTAGRAVGRLLGLAEWSGEDAGRERLERGQLYVVRTEAEWEGFWSRFLPMAMPRALDPLKEMAVIYAAPGNGKSITPGRIFSYGRPRRNRILAESMQR